MRLLASPLLAHSLQVERGSAEEVAEKMPELLASFLPRGSAIAPISPLFCLHFAPISTEMAQMIRLMRSRDWMEMVVHVGSLKRCWMAGQPF